MNPNELGQMIYDMTNKRLKLMGDKSADYAGEDALANFKRMHTVCATMNIDSSRSPTDCALFLVMLKLDRWQNLRNKEAMPKNEAIEDTLLDLHNYIDLAYACELDSKEVKKEAVVSILLNGQLVDDFIIWDEDHYVSHFE